jgi:HEAT repeat protein
MVDGKRIDEKVRARVRAQLASKRISTWERGIKTFERLELRPDAAMVRSLRHALDGSHAWRRERTLYALAVVPVPACYASVLRALDDDDSFIRDAACQAMGAMRRRAAWPQLRRRLEDVDEQVRYSAVEALTWGAHALSMVELRALLGDRSELVRLIVVQALDHYSACPRDRVATVGKILAAHARRDRSPLVQCDLAEWSYARTRSTAAIAKLVRLLSHRRGIVRWRACACIPEDLRPPHAARLLSAVRRRILRERPNDLRDRLVAAEKRLTHSSDVSRRTHAATDDAVS